MHFKFFTENKEVSNIAVPVVGKKKEYIEGELSTLLPFRNLDCYKPSCVYDLSEIV